MVQITLLDMTKKTSKAFVHYKERHTLRLIIRHAYCDNQIKGDKTDAKRSRYETNKKCLLKLRGVARIGRMARPPWAAKGGKFGHGINILSKKIHFLRSTHFKRLSQVKGDSVNIFFLKLGNSVRGGNLCLLASVFKTNSYAAVCRKPPTETSTWNTEA